MLYKKPEQMELEELITAGDAWMVKHPKDDTFRVSLNELKKIRSIFNQTVKPEIPSIPNSTIPPVPLVEDSPSVIPFSSQQKLAEISNAPVLNHNKEGIRTGMIVAGAVAAAAGIPILIYLLSNEDCRKKAMNFLTAFCEECKKEIQYHAPPPLPPSIPGYNDSDGFKTVFKHQN
jgi:hypothetical protein